MDIESHMVLAYHNEGTSSKPIYSQQQDNLMSKGQWGVASTTTTPRPCWPTTGPTRSSVSAAAAVFSNNNSDESSSSWEVRAFAEDAASCSGQWPPRSYTCSFCQREFRTAQALGGHMNVHRRERAEANELALQQQQQQQQLHHHHHQVTPPLPLPPPPAAAVQWWYAPSPAPIPIPVPMATKTSPATPDDDEEEEEVGPYLFAAAAAAGGGGGLTPSILHFSNCKSTVMNKLYMGGAFQPYQSLQSQEAAAVPPEEDNLDLELRLGPSMICGQ